MVDLPDTDRYAIRYRYHQPEEIRYPDSISNQSFVVEDVQDCEISLLDCIASMTILACEDTTIRCGPVQGACKISRCKGCMITVACSHLVISECQDLIVFLYAASEPVIERSDQVTLAPYNLAYPYLRSHFEKVGLDPRRNQWSRVRTSLEYGVNWSLLPTEQFFVDRKDLQDYPSPDDPVPRPERYGGILKGEIVIGSQETKLLRQETAEMPAIIVEQVEQPLPPQHFETVFTPSLSNPASIPHLPPDYPPDSKTLTYVITYDSDQGFTHCCDDISISQIPGLTPALSDLTKAVQPHYLYLTTLQISAFCLLFASLILSLVVILIKIFVEMHDGALAFCLFIIFALFILQVVTIVLLWRGKKNTSSTELETFMAVKQADFHRFGLDITVDLAQVRVKILTS